MKSILTRWISALGLAISAVLGMSGTASAALLTITIAPIALTDVGACKGPDLAPSAGSAVPDFSGNCWDLGSYPKDPGADQISLTGDTYTADHLALPPSFTPLTFTFIPGHTGGGSAGPDTGNCSDGVLNPFSLDRAITINGVSGTLTQSGSLKVGWCFDTLNISQGTASIDVPQIGIVTISVGGVVDLPADLDPEGDLPVTASISPSAEVSLPSTLALALIGIAGLTRSRRRAA
ncbi:MAG: hypothetical protein ABTS16_02575 [Candidatus Accumulibacter phosphatis]|jgi:hypothetical protein|uniref:PEP-CTERM protein-sorting domain-containing protein n=1 Tax=Candidatus Accumulibacter contiguus TaxID=2954381 RepID=A0ABX1T6M3_9PROT|nr:hypothetical protein [Candidatus Accumulibacter contiguus]NMQ04753.1 hypothetical protein [Candidatus Accumulibacter contiguus]